MNSKNKIKKTGYIIYDYKSSAHEVAFLILDEINDILEHRNIKINSSYGNHEEFKINLKIKELNNG